MTADWTDLAISTLRRMWGAGATTQRIADALNVQPDSSRDFTKNGVIGKAHRLLLDRRPNPIRSQVKNPNSKRYNRYKASAEFLFAKEPRASSTPQRKAELATRVPPKTQHHAESDYVRPARQLPLWDGKHVTLGEVGSGQCRFPIGGGSGASLLLCGAPVVSGWCCPACGERAFDKRATAASQSKGADVPDSRRAA